MDMYFNRLALLLLLAMLFTSCGGREHHPEPTAETKRDTVLVTALQLNLRDTPSPKGKVLQVLQKGDLLEIFSGKGNWLEVAAPDGQKGWVYGRYVQIDQKGTEASGQTKITTSPPKKVKTAKAATAAPPKVAKAPPSQKGKTAKSEAAVPPKAAKAPPPKTAPETGQALRQQLESVWEIRRQAHHNGDLALIRKLTSDHSYGTLQNNFAAVGREITPERVTALYELMPDLATFKFVELKQNGPTAGLLYMDEGEKKDDGSNLTQPVHFLFAKFVKEGRGWTVDGILSKGAPKYQKDGSETRYNYAELPEELAIDGKVRPAPKIVKNPEISVLKGMLNISSYGYKTKVSINGIQQGQVENNDYSGAIAGGLNKGMNIIEIVIVRSEKSASALRPKITVRYQPNPGKQREAFSFESMDNFNKRHLFTFMVE